MIFRCACGATGEWVATSWTYETAEGLKTARRWDSPPGWRAQPGGVWLCPTCSPAPAPLVLEVSSG